MTDQPRYTAPEQGPMTYGDRIEAVARAMEPSAFRTYDAGYNPMNGHAVTAFLNAEKTVKAARRKAKRADQAVLRALEEPTDEMNDAGAYAGIGTYGATEIIASRGGGWRIENYAKCTLSEEHFTDPDEAHDEANRWCARDAWRAMFKCVPRGDT